MSQLSGPARRLIDAARPVEDPTNDDRARIRRQLMLRLGTAAVLTTVASSTTSATAAGALGGAAAGGAGLLAKVVVVLGFVSGVGGGTVLALYDGGARPPPVARAAAPSVSEVVRVAAPIEPAPAEPTTETPPPAAAEAERHAPAAKGAQKSAAPAGSPAPTGIDAELQLLSAAQRELSSGRADHALELLERHERSFSTGALGEERRAARVVALCKAGRADEARAEAARFLADRPSSPLAERVRGACR